MTIDLASPPVALPKCDAHQIENRVRNCPRLPSLGSVNSALRELLSADQRYTSQIAEVIRRDPSLTARLLRLVNSVYFGFSTPINSIEEAVFFLGVRQIRQLAMMTPIIEDFQKLAGSVKFEWREFWQHCIGTAILTREVTGAFEVPGDESDYVAGLVHDVGKIVMAAAFPDHFAAIQAQHRESLRDLCSLETEILGVDHTELGALYLRSHRLPELLVETARFHHNPEAAPRHARIIAAVQIADLLIRHAQIGNSGNRREITSDAWLNASGWDILCAQKSGEEKSIAEASLLRSLERLATILDGLV
ncbi:MAG: HDOD domain-containing protein [Verrucomicrobiales bacterium]|nr:HDOD domain-containing protein [Verrucomicrobiales bacterium]